MGSCDPIKMDNRLAVYGQHLRNDPRSFVEGVASFCKQAARYDDGDERSRFSRVLPWLLALGGGYAALKLGSGWGRWAQANDNPNGPVKGPAVRMLELSLPKGNKVLWPGQKGYDDVINFRRAQDDAAWNREFNNSVANGTAKSLTLRDRG